MRVSGAVDYMSRVIFADRGANQRVAVGLRKEPSKGDNDARRHPRIRGAESAISSSDTVSLLLVFLMGE